MTSKPVISYNEFLEFKNEYLRDMHPLLTFGQAFCQKFCINNSSIREATSTAAARVRIDSIVEWSF